MSEDFISEISKSAFSAMEYVDLCYPILSYSLYGTLALIGITPLDAQNKPGSEQAGMVKLRLLLIVLIMLLTVTPVLLFLLIVGDQTFRPELPSKLPNWDDLYIDWLYASFIDYGYKVFLVTCLAAGINFWYHRVVAKYISELFRRNRSTVGIDSLSDIRDEAQREAKTYDITKYYRLKRKKPVSTETPKDVWESVKHYAKTLAMVASLKKKPEGMFLAINEKNEPIYVPYDTWYETNMQVVGPTRYGKGVLLGTLMDQIIANGDTLFYLDPKEDRFAPYIMSQACKRAGRKFCFLSLRDDGYGEWAPFRGGSERDGLTRLELAFDLQYTGNPGTDYYKSQERSDIIAAFDKSRELEALFNLQVEGGKKETRILAELRRWKEVASLRPSGEGFSIARALKENWVVYVRGSLDDEVIKKAMKLFYVEMIQEARRLQKERTTHVTAIIDEVSFLTSKELAGALATAVGFKVNFVLAYQSQEDLLNITDQPAAAKYVAQSIDQNSQVKIIYGGTNEKNAEWAAGMSGTVIKMVPKSEKTTINHVGAETWESQRFLGAQAEALISPNAVLKLPPRVCVVYQPKELAQIAYTSFVEVEKQSFKDLNDWLEHKMKNNKSSKKPPMPSSGKGPPAGGAKPDPKQPLSESHAAFADRKNGKDSGGSKNGSAKKSDKQGHKPAPRPIDPPKESVEIRDNLLPIEKLFTEDLIKNDLDEQERDDAEEYQ